MPNNPSGHGELVGEAERQLLDDVERLRAVIEAVGLDGKSGWLPLAAEAANVVLIMAKDDAPMLGLLADMAMWRDKAHAALSRVTRASESEGP